MSLLPSSGSSLREPPRATGTTGCPAGWPEGERTTAVRKTGWCGIQMESWPKPKFSMRRRYEVVRGGRHYSPGLHADVFAHCLPSGVAGVHTLPWRTFGQSSRWEMEWISSDWRRGESSGYSWLVHHHQLAALPIIFSDPGPCYQWQRQKK